MHALSLSGVCFAGSNMVDLSVLLQGPGLFLASVVLRSACVMGGVLVFFRRHSWLSWQDTGTPAHALVLALRMGGFLPLCACWLLVCR
jgi:uncharacterized membrane protein YraQ (UPF0718 family)